MDSEKKYTAVYLSRRFLMFNNSADLKRIAQWEGSSHQARVSLMDKLQSSSTEWTRNSFCTAFKEYVALRLPTGLRDAASSSVRGAVATGFGIAKITVPIA